MPAVPSWMKNADGSTAVVEKVSPTAARFTFKQPNTLVLTALANADGGDRTYAAFLPAHYLKKFHATYVKKEDLDKLVAGAGFKTWTELFAARNAPPENPERPDHGGLGAGQPRERPGLHAQAKSVLRRRRPQRQPASLSRRGALHVLRRHPGAQPGRHRRRLRHAGAPHPDDELSRLQGEREEREVPRHHVADVRRRRRRRPAQPDLQGRSGHRQADGDQGVPGRAVARRQPGPDQGVGLPRPRRGAAGRAARPVIRTTRAIRSPTSTPSTSRTSPTSCSTGSASPSATPTASRQLANGKRVVLELSVVPAFARLARRGPAHRQGLGEGRREDRGAAPRARAALPHARQQRADDRDVERGHHRLPLHRQRQVRPAQLADPHPGPALRPLGRDQGQGGRGAAGRR